MLRRQTVLCTHRGEQGGEGDGKARAGYEECCES